MHNINRITRMEKILAEASAAVQKLSVAAEAYADIQPDLRTLENYYGSEEWLEDLAADENGALPRDLKRGVLSQDAVYDLLTDNDALLAMLQEITAALENKKATPDDV